MLKKSIFTTLLVLGLLFQGCADENKEANEMVSSNEFVLTSTNNTQYIAKKEGNGFIVENTKGKVIIFDIFATWCPPCQAGAKHLTSLQNKFKDDLVIIGITIEDNIANAKLEEFKKKYDADYTLVNSDQNRPLVNAIATELKLGERFPIPIMAMYLDGKLINHYIGEVQEEFIESDIKRALGK